MLNVFFLTEMAILALFVLIALYIWRYDKKSILFFAGAVIYAALFENLNILISRDTIGGYFYNPTFKFFVFHTPLFIILSWAIILYSTKIITEATRVKQFSMPFLAALLALIVDFGLDTTAIRLKFWFWQGYALNEGYFGVPANNFLGWLIIAFSFYLIYLILDKKAPRQKKLLLITLPLAAYLLFLLIFSQINALETFFNLNKSTEFYLLFSVIMLFIFSIKRNRANKITTLAYGRAIAFFSRLIFHLFGIIGVLAYQFYQENILLLAFPIIFLLLEFSPHFLLKKIQQKT